MGLMHSPNIVRSGLVLYLDAANVKSYPGSGTTWTDLSGNGRDATLLNGPSYNSVNAGTLVFDGSNDYATCVSGSQWALGTSATLEMCVFATGSIVANHRIWCTSNNSSALDAGIGLDAPATGKFFMHGGSVYTVDNFPFNAWILISVVYAGGALTIRFNNIVQQVNGQTSGFNIANAGTLFIGAFNNGSRVFNGRIANFKIYNRALSATEVAQNFNALRGRYGL